MPTIVISPYNVLNFAEGGPLSALQVDRQRKEQGKAAIGQARMLASRIAAPDASTAMRSRTEETLVRTIPKRALRLEVTWRTSF